MAKLYQNKAQKGAFEEFGLSLLMSCLDDVFKGKASLTLSAQVLLWLEVPMCSEPGARVEKSGHCHPLVCLFFFHSKLVSDSPP